MRYPGLLILAVSGVFVSGAASAQGVNAMSGAYVLDAGRSDDVNRAIEGAVARLAFVTRPIARGKLRKTSVPAKRLTIALRGDNVTVAFDGRAPMAFRSNGAPVKWTREDGEQLTVSASISADTLSVITRSDDEQRTTAYRNSPDGKSLNAYITVTSPRLPAPLIYKLVYSRSE
jgi:hypothetical protein